MRSPMVRAFLVSICLVAGASLTFVLAKHPPGIDPLGDAFSAGVELDERIANYHEANPEVPWLARVLVQFEVVSPSARNATATIYLETYDGRGVAFTDKQGNALSDARLAKESAVLSFTPFSAPFSDESIDIKYPLLELETVGPIARQVVLPVSGDQTQFPDDRYEIAFLYALTLPENIWLRSSADVYGPPESVDHVPPVADDWPVAIAAVGSGNMVDMRVEPTFAIASGETPLAPFYVAAVAERPTYFTLLVYLVVLTPLVLGGLFAFRTMGGTRGLDGGASLEIGAALLALIAIRQVLVPTQIDGFTVVDRMLAIQVLLLIVALALVPSHRRRVAEPTLTGDLHDGLTPTATPRRRSPRCIRNAGYGAIALYFAARALKRLLSVDGGDRAGVAVKPPPRR